MSNKRRSVILQRESSILISSQAMRNLFRLKYSYSCGNYHSWVIENLLALLVYGNCSYALISSMSYGFQLCLVNIVLHRLPWHYTPLLTGPYTYILIYHCSHAEGSTELVTRLVICLSRYKHKCVHA
jgi:hypothetical protein